MFRERSLKYYHKKQCGYGRTREVDTPKEIEDVKIVKTNVTELPYIKIVEPKRKKDVALQHAPVLSYREQRTQYVNTKGS